MTKDVRPHLVPDVGSIRFGPWQRFDVDRWTEVAESLDGWDPATDIELTCTVAADWAAVRAASGLPEGFPLVVGATWRSSTSQMRVSLASTSLRGAGPVVVQGKVLGRRAGGVLDIVTVVATAEDWPEAPDGVARWSGSVLAESSSRVALEGNGSMFPTAIVDFTHTPYHPGASWHLECSEELSAPFLGTFQLLINAADGELVGAVTSDRPTPRELALADELRHQVAMSLLDLALRAETTGDLLEVDWEIGSVGDTLRALRESAGGSTAPSEPEERRTWLAGVTRPASGRSLS
jgi:hypothetical protein